MGAATDETTQDPLTVPWLIHRSAGSHGVRALFRFMRFDLAKLDLLLRAERIAMSDPSRFNDPYDCRPSFVMRPDVPPEQIERLVAFIHKSAKEYGSLNDVQMQQLGAAAQAIRGDATTRQAFLQMLSRGFIDSARRHLRLLCFSAGVPGSAAGPALFSQLLWSHYADSHRGMCLVFNATKEPISRALQVDYLPAYPTVNLDSEDGIESFPRVGFLAKAECWAYESEYRLIASDLPRSPWIRHDRGNLWVPRKAVDAVILGTQATEDQREAVIALVKAHAPEVDVWGMVRELGSYSLRIVPWHRSVKAAETIR